MEVVVSPVILPCDGWQIHERTQRIDMDYGNKIQIFIDKKEVLYSHQNMMQVINAFIPYLTNDDLDELVKTFTTLKDHRKEKEYLAHLEASQKSIQSNRHDT